jgi:hypothetical protein
MNNPLTCREDGLWHVGRDYGTMARANDSRRFWSIISLSGHLARRFTSAMNVQVQATCDKLGKRVIQTSVYMAQYISGEIRYRRIQTDASIERWIQTVVGILTLLMRRCRNRGGGGVASGGQGKSGSDKPARQFFANGGLFRM